MNGPDAGRFLHADAEHPHQPPRVRIPSSTAKPENPTPATAYQRKSSTTASSSFVQTQGGTGQLRARHRWWRREAAEASARPRRFRVGSRSPMPPERRAIHSTNLPPDRSADDTTVPSTPAAVPECPAAMSASPAPARRRNLSDPSATHRRNPRPRPLHRRPTSELAQSFVANCDMVPITSAVFAHRSPRLHRRTDQSSTIIHKLPVVVSQVDQPFDHSLKNLPWCAKHHNLATSVHSMHQSQ